MGKIFSQQLKAARALAGLSQAEVCDRAGISLVTLRRLESLSHYSDQVAPATGEKVRAVLEAAGVVFLSPGEVSAGYGVSLRDPV